MIINKAYKYRLYPNKEQTTFLNKSIGCCRFVYNYFLNTKTKYYEEHKEDKKKGLTFIETEHLLTLLKEQEEYQWLKEVNSQSLQYSLRCLDSAYRSFFNKHSDFPNYKKKKYGGSFTIPQFFEINNNKLIIPKFKTALKFKKHRELKGLIKYLTISKTPTNKYYVSIITEQIIKDKVNKKKKVLGIDVNITNLLTTSNNEVFGTNKQLFKKEKRLNRLHRELSIAKKGSKNRDKKKILLSKQYEKIANHRTDYIHKISNYLIKNHDAIVAEDLNIRGMVKNHNLAKSISNQSWGELFRQIKYKALWNSKDFYQIDRFYPSSKIHNRCGYINNDLKLSDRKWQCSQCNEVVDRDYNSACNIRDLGISDMKITTAGTAESHDSGGIEVTDLLKDKSVNSNERGSFFL